MTLKSVYDIPEEVRKNAEGDRYSTVFADFLWNWFGSTKAATNRRIDLSFVSRLSPSELSLAKDLIRRNLKLRYDHILWGASTLNDTEAVPALRRLLADERDLSRRLTIAGELWKLSRDPVFLDCLRDAKIRNPSLFVFGHLLQVLWLDDERALDFLVGLLDEPSVKGYALSLLNELEYGPHPTVPSGKLPHQADYYRKNRLDPQFRAVVVSAIQKRNAESKYGW